MKKDVWTIKNQIVLDFFVGLVVLIAFLIHHFTSGYYSVMLFIAIAGGVFLLSSLVTIVFNRKTIVAKELLKLFGVPLFILVGYFIVGGITGSII